MDYLFTHSQKKLLIKRRKHWQRENKSDLIDGVDLSNESSEVTNILLDLTKRETLNQSSSLVNFLINSFEEKLIYYIEPIDMQVLLC